MNADEYAPAEHRSSAVGGRLLTALGRSAAQRFASDGGREERLIDELRRTLVERDAAIRDRGDTVQVRRELERTPPHALRVRARQRHRDALAEARIAEARADGRLDALSERERTVRDQLSRERTARASDQSRDSGQRLDLTFQEARERRSARLGQDRPERVLDRALDRGRGMGR